MVSLPKPKMDDVVGELMKRSAPFPVAPKPNWVQFAKNIPGKTVPRPTDLKISSESTGSNETSPGPPAVSARKIPVPMPRTHSSSSSDSNPRTPVPLPRTKFNIFNTADTTLERSASLPTPETEKNVTDLVKPLLLHSISEPSTEPHGKISTDPALPVVPELTLKDSEDPGDITWL